jgi:hypothetical protein
MLNIEHDLHMAEGEGQYSYTKNSRRQVIILSHLLQFTKYYYAIYMHALLEFVCTKTLYRRLYL